MQLSKVIEQIKHGDLQAIQIWLILRKPDGQVRTHVEIDKL